MKSTEMTEFPQSHDQNLLASSSSRNFNLRRRNVVNLLARREISPRTKHVPKQHWGIMSRSKSGSFFRPKNEVVRDASHGLLSWVEAESLQHLSAKYCSLSPPPRSTIAAAFSSDGKVLASTHGDHTVKIIDCENGRCLKVLMGHRRTPWVVRFHPLQPQILASGSLDQEVCLWDVMTSKCLFFYRFYRPIASIAFHANGEVLAVASGHKLYMWPYNKRGEESSPTLVLRTRRSLRAVHFHPHAAPYLLTAEVNDIDSSDSIMTKATTLGYLQYPPPAVFVTDGHSRERVNFSSELPPMSPFFFMPPYTLGDSRIELQRDNHVSGVESSASVLLQADTNAAEQNDVTVSPMDTSSKIPSGSQTNTGYTVHDPFSDRMGIGIPNPEMDGMAIDETNPSEGRLHENSTNVHSFTGRLHGLGRQAGNQEVLSELSQFLQFVPSRDSGGWELPFLQGWLMGQSLVGAPSMISHIGGSDDSLAQQISSSILPSNLSTSKLEEAMPVGITIPGASVGSGLQNNFPHSHVPESEYGNHVASVNRLHEGIDIHTIASRIQSEVATSLAAAASAELPCTVKLRVWSYDIQNPCAPLSSDSRRLTIPHAVLCSEMGAHFSPCGRFLAACVACMVPHTEADLGLQPLVHQDHGDATSPTVPHTEADLGLQPLVHQDHGDATSPTRHPISAHQVMYELRVYSLEKATFGSVLASRAIRAAHCLTSIQFSPTSEHILLAYGRRHASLLKCIVIDGETTLPIYTVLEVYRVSDMELVSVLPSTEDEVNVACFHPFAGGGIVYGTKEGKLRVLQCNGAHAVNGT